jgi:hypothetical protein
MKGQKVALLVHEVQVYTPYLECKKLILDFVS